MIVSRRAPIYLPESQKLHYALSGAGLRDANLQNTGLHNVRLIDTGPHIKSVTKWSNEKELLFSIKNDMILAKLDFSMVAFNVLKIQ